MKTATKSVLALKWIKSLPAKKQNVAIRHLLEWAFDSDKMCLRMKEDEKEVDCVFFEGSGESIAEK